MEDVMLKDMCATGVVVVVTVEEGRGRGRIVVVEVKSIAIECEIYSDSSVIE